MAVQPSPARPDTIAGWLQRAVERLQPASPSARLDAELLLAFVLDVPRTHLHAWPERAIDPPQAQRFEGLLQRRAAGEPVAYLLGRQAFYGLDLAVTSATLIPRPETELLVELTLQALEGLDAPRVLDLGTGCGAVALAIAAERTDARVDAVEMDPAAANVARENARRLGGGRVEVLEGSWFEPITGRRYHAVVANPPYVAEDERSLTSPETRFEPQQALYAEQQGLAALRRITEGAGHYLIPGGWLAMEHGFRQGAAVRRHLAEAGFRDVRTAADLAGHERVSCGHWPNGGEP